MNETDTLLSIDVRSEAARDYGRETERSENIVQ